MYGAEPLFICTLILSVSVLCSTFMNFTQTVPIIYKSIIC